MIGETKLRFMTHLLRRKVSACVILHLQATSGLSNAWPDKKAASNNIWLKNFHWEGICCTNAGYGYSHTGAPFCKCTCALERGAAQACTFYPI